MDLKNIVERQTRPVQLLIRWLLGLGVVSALMFVFAKLAEDVWFQEGFSWDAPIILAIHQLGSPTLDLFMRFVTQTGELGAITVAIIMAGWFLSKSRRIEAYTVVVAFGGAVTINSLLKLLFARPRPSLFPPLVVERGFSFPSGHVTASMAVYGLLAVVLWQNKQYGWSILSGLWILLVAVSRVYLGLHYPSDTLAAIAFTSLWVIAVVFAQTAFMKKAENLAA